jgi:hypothetical protein
MRWYRRELSGTAVSLRAEALAEDLKSPAVLVCAPGVFFAQTFCHVTIRVHPSYPRDTNDD